MPKVNNDKVIGFICGMDIPVINDFLAGYIEGAKYVNKDIKVAISYTGDFVNLEKSKEMALEQFNSQKVDTVIGMNPSTLNKIRAAVKPQ